MDIALDPIGYSQALQDAGMPRAQADVIARTQIAGIEKIVDSKELSTKTDIAMLQKDMAQMETRFDAKLDKTKYDILRWMVTMNLALVAAIAALFALLK